MVKFNKEGFTVEVYTGTSPHEDYVNTMSDIVDAIKYQNDNLTINYTHLLELLKQMLPTAEQAKVMVDGGKTTSISKECLKELLSVV